MVRSRNVLCQLRTRHAKLLGLSQVRAGVLCLSLLPSLFQDVDVACFGAIAACRHRRSSLDADSSKP